MSWHPLIVSFRVSKISTAAAASCDSANDALRLVVKCKARIDAARNPQLRSILLDGLYGFAREVNAMLNVLEAKSYWENNEDVSLISPVCLYLLTGDRRRPAPEETLL